jgi:hypothetical protein
MAQDCRGCERGSTRDNSPSRVLIFVLRDLPLSGNMTPRDDEYGHTAEIRPLARLPADQKSPGLYVALVPAKSTGPQAATGAPATLRAYKADLVNFRG